MITKQHLRTSSLIAPSHYFQPTLTISQIQTYVRYRGSKPPLESGIPTPSKQSKRHRVLFTPGAALLNYQAAEKLLIVEAQAAVTHRNSIQSALLHDNVMSATNIKGSLNSGVSRNASAMVVLTFHLGSLPYKVNC